MKKLLMVLGLIILCIYGRSHAAVFAGYDSFCGLPVVVGYDSRTATARTDEFGRKFIHVDPGVMSNWTNSRMFVLAHECAHHLLGHTNPLGELERFSGGTAKQELEADCWAAQQLRQIGYDFDITRTIVEHASQGHFSGGGYPSGVQRAQNILNCVDGRKCEEVNQVCNHPAHRNGDRAQCVHVVPAHPQGDVYPCQHVCPSPYGFVPCHPQGDIGQCQHPVAAHQFDIVPCNHPVHPEGHSEQMCF